MNLSAKSKIILSVFAFFAIVVALMSALSYKSFSTSSQDMKREELSLVGQSVSKAVHTKMQGYFQALELSASMFHKVDGLSKEQAYEYRRQILHDLRRNTDTLMSYYTYKDGTTIDIYGLVKGFNKTAVNREWYTRIHSGEKRVVTGPYLSANNNVVMAVGVPIMTRGDILASLCVNLKLTEITNFSNNILDFHNVILTRDRGFIMAIADNSLIGKTLWDVIPGLEAHDDKKYLKNFQFTHLGRVYEASLNTIPDLDWQVWTFEAQDIIKAASNDNLKANIFQAVIALAFSALMLSIFTSNLVFTPISNMTEVMYKLAKGILDVEVPGLKKKDEIGKMAQSVQVFKENAQRIQILEEERAATQRELQYRATHDPLTGALNRFALRNMEDVWLAPNAPPFALMYIDLDNFKHINDAFGHTSGDVILSEVYQRLQRCSPRGTVIVRHGGDEFVVFVPLSKDICMATVGEEIIHEISQQYLVSELKLHTGASIGIALFPQDAMQLDPLMIAADLAMRNAKRKKNNYAFYNHEMQEVMRRKVKIEYELHHAIDRNEIYVVYQPQISADGSLYGVEALVRWDNATLGSVPPGQFISVAEETGQIIDLGRFVAGRACAEFADILKIYDLQESAPSLSINISINQFLEGDFLDNFLRCIKMSGLKPHHLTVEITETVFIDEPDIVLPVLNKIRRAGVKVSLDDFGTGYSSLSTLRTLPIDELKIDKTFIDNICSVNQDSEMTRSIIEMGHVMHMLLISEGVETQEQADLLKELGCDVFQGYYFAKPLPKDGLVAFIGGMFP